MNSDIMLLCNTLIYNHKLRCGNETVARRVLHVENLDQVPAGWLRQVCQQRVVLLDTDEAALGEDDGGRGSNRGEARLVGQIVKVFFSSFFVVFFFKKKKKKWLQTLLGTCGVPNSSVGVLSPFRAQVALIREELAGLAVEVGTVDSSQGRDWDCVLLSLARSNDAHLAGELLEDWRRLNVAISRAKSKLIVIADRATMNSVHIVKDLCDLMSAQGWVITLPKDYSK
jgi:DNA replication ATP-dependent helicase Dna2